MPPSSGRNRSGWRRWVHRATAGVISPKESASARELRLLRERVRQPAHGDYSIAVVSVKGGVGKTTTTMCLGLTFAEHRSDRVVALDANPDFGTLSTRVASANPATLRDLVEAPTTERYTQVRAYASQTVNRLDIIAGEHDPSTATALRGEEYLAGLDILRRHYTLSLTDCGTGLSQPVMEPIFRQADCIILVTTPALDGVKSAWTTLDWLAAHGFEDLVPSTVVVVNTLTRSGLEHERITALFGQRCRAVQVIPHDAHIAQGSIIDLDSLHPATTRAYLELAAMIADDFAPRSGRHCS